MLPSKWDVLRLALPGLLAIVGFLGVVLYALAEAR